MNLRFPEHPEVALALLGVEVLEQEVWVYRVWRGDARACGLSISDGKKKKPSTLSREGLLVGDGGFEPPKALPADLQSVPFGHSGNPPYLLCRSVEPKPKRGFGFERKRGGARPFRRWSW